MNTKILKFGYWSSVIALLSFIIYIVCFIAILFVNPLFTWTNFEEYIRTSQTSNQAFKHIAMFFMIVYGACFVAQICSINEIVDSSKRFYVKLSELFGLGFFVLIDINYFIQISSVRLQINMNQTRGLEQFIQADPYSGISAVNMLGWTIFFGLSCIFVSLAFGNTNLEKVIKYAFLANGIMMLLGAVGYVFNIIVLTFFCMYLGMGATIFAATIPLCRLFRNLQTQ